MVKDTFTLQLLLMQVIGDIVLWGLVCIFYNENAFIPDWRGMSNVSNCVGLVLMVGLIIVCMEWIQDLLLEETPRPSRGH